MVSLETSDGSLRIRELAARDRQDDRLDQKIAKKRAMLSAVKAEHEQVSQNLARAANEKQYKAISEVFNQLGERVESLEAEIATVDAKSSEPTDVDSAVEMAKGIISQLTELAGQVNGLANARKIFDILNARLFLDFQPVKVKKRILNKITGGVVTFGDASPPIEIYLGPTGRRQIKGPVGASSSGPGAECLPAPPVSSVRSSGEQKSLRNVSRGDKTAIELFRCGVHDLYSMLPLILKALVKFPIVSPYNCRSCDGP